MERQRRREAGEAGATKEAKDLAKRIRRAVRSDKRARLHQRIDAAVNVKHKWRAIRQLKQRYQPRTYGRRDRHGRMAALLRQAGATADYLEKEHWAAGAAAEHELRDTPIVEANPGEYDVDPPTRAELDAVIAGMKGGKAAGPDECGPELYKLVDEGNRQTLHELVCKVWNDEK